MSLAKVAVVCGFMALLVSACGIQEAGGRHHHIYENHAVTTARVDDPRTPQVTCLKSDKLPFHEYYADGASICPRSRSARPPQGPTIIFYPTAGIAQGLQIMGQERAAEVIGSLLVYPNQASQQSADQGRGLRRRSASRAEVPGTWPQPPANDTTAVSATSDSGFIRDFAFPLPGFIKASAGMGARHADPVHPVVVSLVHPHAGRSASSSGWTRRSPSGSPRTPLGDPGHHAAGRLAAALLPAAALLDADGRQRRGRDPLAVGDLRRPDHPGRLLGRPQDRRQARRR